MSTRCFLRSLPLRSRASFVLIAAASLLTGAGQPAGDPPAAGKPPTTAPSATLHSLAPGMRQPGRPEVEMVSYVFGMLRRGPSAPAPGSEPTDESRRLQAEHIAHLEAMWKKGALQGAGPILQEGDLRGILIFSGVSTEEARALAEQDPKVKAGMLSLELHPWMAAAGIGADYNARAAKGEKPGMVTLYLGLLRAGPDRGGDEAVLHELQAAHLANIARLGREGKLPLAGPFLDDGELRGVFVFQAASLEEARALADSDPSVAAGRLSVELYPWLVAEGVVPAAPPVPEEHGH